MFKFARAKPGEAFLRLARGKPVDRRASVYGISEGKGFVDLFATILWRDRLEFTGPDRSGLPRFAHEFAQTQDPNRIEVRGALERWATEFHLETEWVFDEALATMIKWLQQGEQSVDLRWASYSVEPDYSFAELASVPILRIEEQWAFETPSVIRGRVARRLNEFESEVRAYAGRIGFRLSKREPNRPEYRWLALARCKQYNTTQILDWHRQHYKILSKQKIRPDTIRHALKNAAKELGLKPWPRSPGRPTTNKT
jgi:hypothetical protein